MNSKNFIPTGFPSLNKILGGGFHNGSLNVIASRPGMGKTSFAIQCTADMCQNTEKSIYIFSLEMSSELIKKKYKDIGRENHIIVDYTASITLSKMSTKLAKIPDIAAIFIDYIQLITTDGSEKGHFASAAEIAGELKLIAKETDIPVICTSQLSRALDLRENHRPLLSDIEEPFMQNADTILYVYGDSYYDKTADDSTAEIGILKNHYGDCKVLPFHWCFPKFSEYGCQI